MTNPGTQVVETEKSRVQSHPLVLGESAASLGYARSSFKEQTKMKRSQKIENARLSFLAYLSNYNKVLYTGAICKQEKLFVCLFFLPGLEVESSKI